MTWREDWAAGLTRRQRHNLRSWSIDVPEPQTIEQAHWEALAAEAALTMRRRVQAAEWAKARETALGPTNVWTGRRRNER